MLEDSFLDYMTKISILLNLSAEVMDIGVTWFIELVY